MPLRLVDLGVVCHKRQTYLTSMIFPVVIYESGPALGSFAVHDMSSHVGRKTADASDGFVLNPLSAGDQFFDAGAGSARSSESVSFVFSVNNSSIENSRFESAQTESVGLASFAPNDSYFGNYRIESPVYGDAVGVSKFTVENQILDNEGSK